jgi:hypothetical protein
MYEMYCPANFIKMRKFNYVRQLKDRMNWTEDQLEVINYKRNSITFGKFYFLMKNYLIYLLTEKPLPNDANFQDAQLNSLLFKNF